MWVLGAVKPCLYSSNHLFLPNQVLLKHGASVNSRADHRTCLQIMYWSKFRPENFVLCSEILVRHGIDVNAMDHNNNTALDYLAWELGQKWYQISKGRFSAINCVYLESKQSDRGGPGGNWDRSGTRSPKVGSQ